PIAEPPAGDFEDGVRHSERGKDVAHLHGGEFQLFRDRARGLPDGGAIEVSDEGECEPERDHPVAFACGGILARGWGGRHVGRSYQVPSDRSAASTSTPPRA